jgi:hypothetical protein
MCGRVADCDEANRESAVTTNGSQRFFMTANILVEEGSSRLSDVRFAVAASPAAAAAASRDWNDLHGFAIELGGVSGALLADS